MPLEATEAFRSEVARARPTRLVVMLYDEAITGLVAAINAIRDNDIEARCNRINVVTELVATLHLSLDMEKGGDVAEQLGSIYRFILGQLIRINISSDAEKAAQIIDVLKPLRDAWDEVDRRVEKGEDITLAEAAMLQRVEAAGNRLSIHAA
ncbi:flagellar export chaperone FliS [Pelagibius sp.]|uniref:flagellar export chaperone FliS n=1 Tax=Pelagibius sp. TaxID=1931238 RepID=UPI003BB14384